MSKEFKVVLMKKKNRKDKIVPIYWVILITFNKIKT